MAGLCLNFGYERYFCQEDNEKKDLLYDVVNMIQKNYTGKDYTAENRFLDDFDAAIQVNPNEDQSSRIAKHVERFVEQLLDKTKVIEPHLQLKVIKSGSFYSHLKVGCTNEFDFMIDISSVSSHPHLQTKHMRFQNETYTWMLLFNGFMGAPGITPNNYFCIPFLDMYDMPQPAGFEELSQLNRGSRFHALKYMLPFCETRVHCSSLKMRCFAAFSFALTAKDNRMIKNWKIESYTDLQKCSWDGLPFYEKSQCPNFVVVLRYKQISISIDLVPCIKFKKVDDDFGWPTFNPYFQTKLTDKTQFGALKKKNDAHFNQAQHDPSNTNKTLAEHEFTLCLKHGFGFDVFKQIEWFHHQTDIPCHQKLLHLSMLYSGQHYDPHTPVKGCNSCIMCRFFISDGISPQPDPMNMYPREHTVFKPTKSAAWPHIPEDIIDDLYLVCPYSRAAINIDYHDLPNEPNSINPSKMFRDFLTNQPPCCVWRLSTSILEKRVLNSLSNNERRSLRILKYLFQPIKYQLYAENNKTSTQRMTTARATDCKTSAFPSYLITCIYLRMIMYLTKHQPELREYLESNTYVCVRVILDILDDLMKRNDDDTHKKFFIKDAIFEDNFTLRIPNNDFAIYTTASDYLSYIVKHRKAVFHHTCPKPCEFCNSYTISDRCYGYFKNKPNIVYQILDDESTYIHSDDGNIYLSDNISFGVYLEFSYYRVTANFDKQEYLLLRKPYHICDMHRILFLNNMSYEFSLIPVTDMMSRSKRIRQRHRQSKQRKQPRKVKHILGQLSLLQRKKPYVYALTINEKTHKIKLYMENLAMELRNITKEMQLEEDMRKGYFDYCVSD